MSDSYHECFQQAAEALEARQYARAENLQQQGLELLRRQIPIASQIPDELEKLAHIHFVQDKFENAASEFEQVLELRTPTDKSAFLRIAYWLAKSRFAAQKYDMAEAVLRRALSEADAAENVALYSYELGFLMYFVGRYQEAEGLLLRALPLYEATKGPSDPWTVEILERLALTYLHCPGIGKDPEPYFKRAVDVIKPEGETRKIYIENLCRFAEFIAEHERFQEADELYLRILELLNDFPEQDESHWVASSCLKYFRKRGRDELVASLVAKEAKYDVYGEILAGQIAHAEQTLSEDNPRLAKALFNAGNNAIFQGKYEDAEKLLYRSFAAYERIHGNESELVATVLNRICVTSRMLKKFSEAERAVQRALEIARRRFPQADVLPRSLENFALLRQAQGRSSEAIELYRQAVQKYESICGFPSYETVEALYRQSGFFLRVGDFSFAEAAIRRALSVVDSVDELSDYEVSDYWSVLASVLDSAGRQSEAREMERKAQELYERAEKQSQSEEET